jgi:hypothetical protein
MYAYMSLMCVCSYACAFDVCAFVCVCVRVCVCVCPCLNVFVNSYICFLVYEGGGKNYELWLGLTFELFFLNQFFL